MISDPLSVRDCCLVTDGGGAVIMVRAERARDFPNAPVYFLGGATALSHRSIAQMDDLTVSAAARSGPQAYAMAGLGPKDVDVLALYDAFTINTILFLEDLGFCPKGEGGRFVSEGHIAPGGALPVNTNGGGLSCVHSGHVRHLPRDRGRAPIARELRRPAGRRGRDGPRPRQWRHPVKPGHSPARHTGHIVGGALISKVNQITTRRSSDMSGALAGKVIAVTGAGRGIGRDIALLAAREGAKVVVNDIGASLSGEGGEAGPAEAVVVEIEQTGGEALAHTRSIAEPEGALSLIEETIGRFGRIDGVVNNAGILRDKIFHRMQPEDWEAVIRGASDGLLLRLARRRPVFPRTGQRRLRAFHLDERADRQSRPGQLRRRQTGDCRPVALHCPRHAALRRTIQLRGSLRLEPDDRLDPHRHARAGGPRGQAPADDPGQDRAAGRPSAERRG